MSDYDVVIVGGGIYGTATALELSERSKRVLLLEKAEIACGASGGPGERGIRSVMRDLREIPIFARAIRKWVSRQNALAGGVGFRQIGGVTGFEFGFGIRSTEVLGRVSAHAAALNALGVEVRVLDEEQLREIEPQLGAGLCGALFAPGDGVVDHTVATRAHAAAAQGRGAVIRESSPVRALRSEGPRIVEVELESGERIQVSGEVILLCNTEVPSLLDGILTEEELLPTWAEIPQMVYVSNPRDTPINHLFGHLQRRLAVKQLPDGTMMLSGGMTVERADGATTGCLSSLAGNLADALQTFPFLEEAEFQQLDASRTDTFTTDGTAIVSRPEAVENVVFGYGWSGHGFAISLGFAELIAEWVATGVRAAELEPFDHRRFQGRR